MPENSEPPTISPLVESQKSARNWKKILLVLLVVLFLISLVGVGLWLLVPGLTGEPASSSPKQATPSAKPTPKVKHSKRIAYVKDLNIWLFDPAKSVYTQITKDGKKDKLENIEPQFIHSNLLAYVKCRKLNGKSQCLLSKYNLKSKKLDVILEKTSDTYSPNLVAYDWSTNDEILTYIYRPDDSQTEVRLYDIESGDDKLLKKITDEPFGSGAPGNVTNIKFSPDEKNILVNIRLYGEDADVTYLSTLNEDLKNPSGEPQVQLAAGTLDRNEILIMDLSGKTIKLLSKYYMYGAWIDNNKIAYLRQAGSVFTLDLTEKRETKLPIGTGWWSSLEISPDMSKIALQKGYEIWVFDLKSKKNKRIVKLKSNPVWYSENTLLVNNLEPCEPGSGACMGAEKGYTFGDSASVIDLNSKKTKFTFDVEGWYYGGKRYVSVSPD